MHYILHRGAGHEGPFVDQCFGSGSKVILFIARDRLRPVEVAHDLANFRILYAARRHKETFVSHMFERRQSLCQGECGFVMMDPRNGRHIEFEWLRLNTSKLTSKYCMVMS